MRYSIELSKTHLFISQNGKRLYHIRITNLADSINVEGHKISEWINQLSEKSWHTIEMLYDVAEHIQQQHPENEIDWLTTFMIGERGDYLDKAFEIKESLDQIDEKSGFKTLMKRIRFGQDSHNKIEQNIVKNIVLQKLKEHNLPYDK